MIFSWGDYVGRIESSSEVNNYVNSSTEKIFDIAKKHQTSVT